MTIKRRLQRLEAHLTTAGPRYIIRTMDDYRRVRRELGCKDPVEYILELAEDSSTGAPLPDYEDPYETLKASGELVEAPEFEVRRLSHYIMQLSEESA